MPKPPSESSVPLSSSLSDWGNLSFQALPQLLMSALPYGAYQWLMWYVCVWGLPPSSVLRHYSGMYCRSICVLCPVPSLWLCCCLSLIVIPLGQAILILPNLNIRDGKLLVILYRKLCANLSRGESMGKSRFVSNEFKSEGP